MLQTPGYFLSQLLRLREEVVLNRNGFPISKTKYGIRYIVSHTPN